MCKLKTLTFALRHLLQRFLAKIYGWTQCRRPFNGNFLDSPHPNEKLSDIDSSHSFCRSPFTRAETFWPPVLRTAASRFTTFWRPVPSMTFLGTRVPLQQSNSQPRATTSPQERRRGWSSSGRPTLWKRNPLRPPQRHQVWSLNQFCLHFLLFYF